MGVSLPQSNPVQAIVSKRARAGAPICFFYRSNRKKRREIPRFGSRKPALEK